MSVAVGVAKAADGFIGAPKLPIEFLKTVSSEVKAAINAIVPLEYIIGTQPVGRPKKPSRLSENGPRLSSAAESTERITRANGGRKRRPPDEHEILFNHVLHALHHEEHKAHVTSEKPSYLKHHHAATLTNHATTKPHDNQQLHRKKKPGVYRPPTPDIVRHLANRYRIPLDEKDSFEQPSTKSNAVKHEAGHIKSAHESAVPKHKPVAQKTIHGESDEDLQQIRKLVRQQHQTPKYTLPAIGSDKVHVSLKRIGDSKLPFPIVNYHSRSAANKLKTARNDPEHFNGIQPVETDWTPAPKFVKPIKTRELRTAQVRELKRKLKAIREAPKDEVQADPGGRLAGMLRDRLMQTDRTVDILKRTRDLKHQECRLRRQRKQVEELEAAVKLAESRGHPSAVNEQKLATVELTLRESDLKTISFIKNAQSASERRDRLRVEFEKEQTELEKVEARVASLRQKKLFMERLANVVCSIVRTRHHVEQQCYKPTDLPDDPSGNPRNDAPLECADLVPMVPKITMAELESEAMEIMRQSDFACREVAEMRQQRTELMTDLGNQGEEVIKKVSATKNLCSQLEAEAENARYDGGDLTRELCTRSTRILQRHLFRCFTRSFNDPEEDHHKMLDRMTDFTKQFIERLQNIPTKFVHKCFKVADQDIKLQETILDILHQKELSSKRFIRMYYRKTDPPTLAWERTEFLVKEELDKFGVEGSAERSEADRGARIEIKQERNDTKNEYESVEVTSTRPTNLASQRPEWIARKVAVSDNCEDGEFSITTSMIPFTSIPEMSRSTELSLIGNPVTTASQKEVDKRIKDFFENYEQIMALNEASNETEPTD